MKFADYIGWSTHLKPFLYKQLPAKTGWSSVLGTLCALVFIILVCTGIILAFYYVPSPDKAYDSVQYITNELPAGHILRGLHHWGAGLMILLVFVHQMITYFNGSYIKPRQFTWLTGACLFLVTLGLGFTGYLLPWDMKAYWATVVGANIPNQYPLVGQHITNFIMGGDGMSGFTLTRFYSIHTLLLPALLLVFMAMHIYLIRVHNLSDPRERLGGEELPPDDTAANYRFYPEHLGRTAIAFGAVFVILLLLAWNCTAHLEAPAGTLIPDYLPRPEWYYMWVFQLLTYFTGAWEMVGSLLVPVGGVMLMFLVPFISESRMKGLVNRPVSMAIGLTFLVSVIYLTSMAYSEAKPYNEIVMVPSKPLSAEAQKGLHIYVERQCSYCHNIMGQGGHRTGPDLSNVVAKKRTSDYLIKYVKNPASILPSTTMSDYDLEPEELKALASFMLSLDFKRGVKAVPLSQAEVTKNISNQPSQ